MSYHLSIEAVKFSQLAIDLPKPFINLQAKPIIPAINVEEVNILIRNCVPSPKFVGKGNKLDDVISSAPPSHRGIDD